MVEYQVIGKSWFEIATAEKRVVVVFVHQSWQALIRVQASPRGCQHVNINSLERFHPLECRALMPNREKHCDGSPDGAQCPPCNTRKNVRR